MNKPQPIRNLVFAGGGTKGVSLVGAMKIVEQVIGKKDIVRCASTSVGSLFAALYCCGFSNEEIRQELEKVTPDQFLDGVSNLTQKKVHSAINKHNHGQHFFSFVALKGAKGPAKSGIKNEQGIFKGNKIVSWLNDCLLSKTGIPNLTYGELYNLHLKEPDKYKLIYMVTVNLSTGRQVVLCHENVPDAVIAHGARCSAAFPYVLTPHQIWRKAADGTVYPDKLGHVYTDGGLADNCAISLFDKQRFLTNGASGDDTPCTNPETLAMRFVESETKDYYDLGQDIPVIDVSDALSFSKQLIGGSFIIQETYLDQPENRKRTIRIDSLGIGVFDLELVGEKLEIMIQSGEIAALAHFGKISREVENEKKKEFLDKVQKIQASDRKSCVIF